GVCRYLRSFPTRRSSDLHFQRIVESCQFFVLRFLSSSVTPPIVQKVYYNLISISTPEGRSRRMSESTVCGVGLTISISRLCVRISNCSRPSLYLCDERQTENTTLSVGRGIGPETFAPERLAVPTIFSADGSKTLYSYAFKRIRIFFFAITFPPLRPFSIRHSP